MKLSIITINRNNAEGLRKTIESVAAQTLDDFEYIVIDGASTDGSVDVIKQYEDKITYWVSEPDKGIYNAMNKGIVKAHGEYLQFLNSGDYLMNENVLESAFAYNFDADIVYGEQNCIKNNVVHKGVYIEPQYLTFLTYLSATLPHQSTFIKRKLFDRIGLYNEKNKIVSDWEWFAVALFRYNVSLVHIKEIIACYDLSGVSNDKEMEKLHLKERNDCLYRNFPRLMKDVEIYNRLYNKYYNIPRVIRAFYNRLHGRKEK